ncbi:MAG: hypothetical protein LC104_00640 [Bacteroidales bacterium]|nr:hypothetical protein [Bacteroidales bacterium]
MSGSLVKIDKILLHCYRLDGDWNLRENHPVFILQLLFRLFVRLTSWGLNVAFCQRRHGRRGFSAFASLPVGRLMPQFKPPPDELLALAAELRAGGASWETVAENVGRTERTVRQWPTSYARRWKKFLRAAERQQLTDATAESVLTLRRQLRSPDEKASRDAAMKLMQFRIAAEKRTQTRRGKPADSGNTHAQTIAAYIARLTDAELDQLIAELGSSPPVTGSGPADSSPA